MVKFGFGVTVSILLMACVSTAENMMPEELKLFDVTPDEVVRFLKLDVVDVQGEFSKVDAPVNELEELNTQGVKKMILNHDIWNVLLKKNVTASGKVNYKGMKAELSNLTAYLTHLKNTPPQADWSKNEKLSYWINLYNASTVYLIASNYPTTSIKKLNRGKPWEKKFVKSGDKVYSLNQIENEIIRPQFKDPRIHAALNCAAVSCPKMLNEAFKASTLNNQLNMLCYAWINDYNRNEVTPNTLKLSKIFEWYGADFKAGGGVISFVSKYNRSKIIISPKAKISYKAYNWDLNE